MSDKCKNCGHELIMAEDFDGKSKLAHIFGNKGKRIIVQLKPFGYCHCGCIEPRK